jgi:hypothetical protein
MEQIPEETSEGNEVLISGAYSFMRIGTAVALARGAYHKFEGSPPQERLEKIINAFNKALDGDKNISLEVKENFLRMTARYYKERLGI